MLFVVAGQQLMIVHLIHLIIVHLDLIEAYYVRVGLLQELLEVASLTYSIQPINIPVPDGHLISLEGVVLCGTLEFG